MCLFPEENRGFGLTTQIFIQNFSPKTLTLWKIHSHIDYFEEFQDQKVAYYHFPPFGQNGLPKTPFKKYMYGDFPENPKIEVPEGSSLGVRAVRG